MVVTRFHSIRIERIAIRHNMMLEEWRDASRDARRCCSAVFVERSDAIEMQPFVLMRRT